VKLAEIVWKALMTGLPGRGIHAILFQEIKYEKIQLSCHPKNRLINTSFIA
jgi:hypothetical protein